MVTMSSILMCETSKGNNIHTQHSASGRVQGQAAQCLGVILFLLEPLGLMVNREKPHLNPAQELEYLQLLVYPQCLQLYPAKNS